MTSTANPDTADTSKVNTVVFLDKPVFPQSSEDDSDNVAAVDSVPRKYINKLSPSAGTSFYKHDGISVFQQESVPKANGWITSGNITWDADVHVYATGANPADQVGWQRNGRVKIVIVFHGRSYFVDRHLDWVLYRIKIGGTSMMLPVDPNGASHGEFEIVFNQTMSLFEGQTPVQFDAIYERDFSHYGYSQQDNIYSVAGNLTAMDFKNFVTNKHDFQTTTNTYGLTLTSLPVGYWPNDTIPIYFDCVYQESDGASRIREEVISKTALIQVQNPGWA